MGVPTEGREAMSTMTQAHIDGTCGGDRAGCERCIEIAAIPRINWPDPRYKALEARRNWPHFGQAMYRDPDAERKP